MTMTLSGDGTITGLVAGGLPNATVTADDLAAGAAVSNIGYTPTNQQAENINFRNRIINGDMRIDQRNAGASVTLSATGYTLDRWNGSEDTSAAVTCQRSTDAPTGYTNSALLTTTTAASATASQRCIFSQYIEGFNVADLGFGAAGAKTVTISFWVKSSLTGTYCVAIRNGAGNRSYVAQYAISSANTWEQKTVTIAGDTTGTWLKDNGVGLRLDFDLGSGSDFVATVNTWTAANNFTTASQTNFINNLNATWYITGVQLEVGSVATPFERRPYGTELALCQRYFAKMQNDGSGANVSLGVGTQTTTTDAYINIKYPVTMRSEPTVAISSTEVTDFTNFSNAATLSSNLMGYDSGTITCSYTTGGTANRPIFLIIANNTTGFLSLSAEL